VLQRIKSPGSPASKDKQESSSIYIPPSPPIYTHSLSLALTFLLPPFPPTLPQLPFCYNRLSCSKNNRDVSDSGLTVPKMSAHPSFFVWQYRMKGFLQQKNLWPAIVRNAQYNQWNAATRTVNSEKAHGFITQALKDSLIHVAAGVPEDSPNQLWDELDRKYGSRSQTAQQALRDQKSQIKFASGTSISEYFEQVQGLRAQLDIAHVPYEEIDIFRQAIDGLPDSFYSAQKAILQSWQMPNWEEARNILIRRELKMSTNITPNGGDATTPQGVNFTQHATMKSMPPQQTNDDFIFAEDKQIFLLNERGRRSNFVKHDIVRYSDRGRKRDRSPSPDPYERETRRHYQSPGSSNRPPPFKRWRDEKGNRFRYVSRKSNSPRRSPRPRHMYVHEEIDNREYYDEYDYRNQKDEEEEDDPVLHFGFSNPSSRKSNWIFDTGATQHITNDRSILHDEVPCHVPIMTGSSNVVTARIMGKVILKAKDTLKHPQITLENVLFCEQAPRNVISFSPFYHQVKTSQVVDSFIMKDKVKDRTVMECRINEERLFILETHIAMKNQNKHNVTHYFVIQSDPNNINTWHHRLNHLNERTLKAMAKRGQVAGMPAILKGKLRCHHCIVSRMKQLPYRKSRKIKQHRNRAANVGRHIHSDQAGPITPRSIHQNNYFIVFIDDASLMTFIFFMKSLSETPATYLKMKAIVENQLGTKIQVFQSDDHSTYKSHTFTRILEDDGTFAKRRAPYAKNQNPVAEVIIGQVINEARTILQHSGIPNIYWEEALQYVIYNRNRTPRTHDPHKTPYERCFKSRPDVTYCKPFGCMAYYFVHKEERKGKFKLHAKPAAFLGYSTHHQAYQLLDIETRSIKTSRDVVFFEDVFPMSKDTSSDPYTTFIRNLTEKYNNEDTPTSEPFSSLDHFVNPTVGNSIIRETPNESATIPLNTPNITDPPQVDPTPTTTTRQSSRSNRGTPATRFDEQYHFTVMDTLREETAEWYLAKKIDPDSKIKEPNTIAEAMKGDDWPNYLKGIYAELQALAKTNTFAKAPDELLKLVSTNDIRVHGTRHVLKLKFDENGNIA
jgi:hypothetical protein